MRRSDATGGPGPLQLLDESAGLLRRAPPAALAAHLAGTVPFLLGALFFWADMSRGAMAWQRCSLGALGVTLLYLWKRTWQSRMGAILRATAAGAPVPRWTGRDWIAAAAMHARLSTWSLLLLPAALLCMVPFAWVYAHHQNLTAVCATPAADADRARARATALARLWPHANHYALIVLLLFGTFLFANVVAAAVMLPMLAKSFLGIESWFTLSADWVFDSTFLVTVLALTHLVMDLLVKTHYALRCHYGDARRTGLDLLAELRRLAPAGRAAAAALLLAALPATAPADFQRTAVPAGPAAAAPLVSGPSIPAEDLDADLRHTLSRPEFAWRLPREAVGEDEEPRTWLGRTLAAIASGVKQAVDWTGRTVRRIGDAFGRWLRRSASDGPDRGGSGLADDDLRLLGWIGLGFIAALVLLQALRIWRSRRRKPADAATAPAPAAPPDLEDESVLATHLPEEEWLALAARMRDTGELRKAVRAVFLAMLACLARQEWITVSRAKSNLEYRRELARRARTAAAPFDEGVRLFERSWYGTHPATPESIGKLEDNLEALRGKPPV